MGLEKAVGGPREDVSAALREARESLWTGVGPDSYADGGERFQAAVLEQWKVYVEMAERLSARRSLTNTFFMTLNSLIVGTLAAWGQSRPAPPAYVLILLLLPVLAQCVAWFGQVRSYRQVGAAKYLVVGALEERLPASPFWRAEWHALGEGRDRRRYWPLTRLEQWIPVLFGSTYVLGFVAVLAR